MARGSYRGSNDWLVDATTPGRGIGSGEGGKERGEDRNAGDGEGEPGRGARVGWLMLFNDT